MTQRLSVRFAGVALVFFLFPLASCFDEGPASLAKTFSKNEEVAGLASTDGTVDLEFDKGVVHVKAMSLPAAAAGEVYEVHATMMDGDEMKISSLTPDSSGNIDVEPAFAEDMNDISEIRIIRENETTKVETLILKAVFQNVTSTSTGGTTTDTH